MSSLPSHLLDLADGWGDECLDYTQCERKRAALRAILTAAWAVGESRGADEILRTIERLTEAMKDGN